MKQMFREIQDFYLDKVKWGHQSRGCRGASKLEKKKKSPNSSLLSSEIDLYHTSDMNNSKVINFSQIC